MVDELRDDRVIDVTQRIVWRQCITALSDGVPPADGQFKKHGARFTQGKVGKHLLVGMMCDVCWILGDAPYHLGYHDMKLIAALCSEAGG